MIPISRVNVADCLRLSESDIIKQIMAILSVFLPLINLFVAAPVIWCNGAEYELIDSRASFNNEISPLWIWRTANREASVASPTETPSLNQGDGTEEFKGNP